jgi:hypothetical protein
MPAILVKVRYQGAVPGVTLTRREMNRVLEKAWFQPGKNWAGNLRPKHFTKEGEQEYGYEPRSGEQQGASGKAFWRSYTGRKLKEKGHTLPLVWSGELRDKARTSCIEATSKGVRVFLSEANKAKFHNPKSKIDMRAELTRVSIAEAGESTEILAASMQEEFDRLRMISIEKTVAGWYGPGGIPQGD